MLRVSSARDVRAMPRARRVLAEVVELLTATSERLIFHGVDSPLDTHQGCPIPQRRSSRPGGPSTAARTLPRRLGRSWPDETISTWTPGCPVPFERCIDEVAALGRLDVGELHVVVGDPFQSISSW